MGPVRALHGREGLKLTLVVVRCLLGPLGMFGPMPALLGLIASPNSPNGGYNQPLATHSSQPPVDIGPIYYDTKLTFIHSS